MARSDKAPFRREGTMTSSGFFLSSDGFYVGDIRTLHMDILNGNETSYLLEGKAGRTGEWQRVQGQSLENRHFKDINISSYEYIRLRLYDVKGNVEIVIFGYEGNPVQSKLNVVQNKDIITHNIEMLCLLNDMKEELKKLNIYMSEILGEEL